MAHHPALAHHFDDLEQQHETAALGMWAFLVTEVLFFGGLFCAYAVYRYRYPEAFAEASAEIGIPLGFLNTLVLLASSLTMALSIHAAQSDDRRGIRRFLWGTIALGTAFLGVKAVEYSAKFSHHFFPGPSFDSAHFEHPQAELFFGLYFAMTGMHALHMVIGIGLLLWLVRMTRLGRLSSEHHSPLEMTGLYWHFVDIVWIFLFPLLYLIGRFE